jgi:hypothetical protein
LFRVVAQRQPTEPTLFYGTRAARHCKEHVFLYEVTKDPNGRFVLASDIKDGVFDWAQSSYIRFSCLERFETHNKSTTGDDILKGRQESAASVALVSFLHWSGEKVLHFRRKKNGSASPVTIKRGEVKYLLADNKRFPFFPY